MSLIARWLLKQMAIVIKATLSSGCGSIKGKGRGGKKGQVKITISVLLGVWSSEKKVIEGWGWGN